MEQILETGQKMGLNGEKLQEFVIEEQKRAEREAEAERQFNLQREKMKYDHDQAMEKIRQEQAHKLDQNVPLNATMPELPVFEDDKDSIDDYLQRFERFARAQNWDKTRYAIILSALLTGKALTVYARLSDNDAADYDKIKTALLKNYNLNEEGFRLKFRRSEPKENEGPTQYMTRIERYLERWIETAGALSREELKTLIVREQFITMCSRDLAIHLNERQFVSVTEMCQQAERYLQARKQTMTTSKQEKFPILGYKEDSVTTEQRQRRECYNCKKFGHVRAECRNEGGGCEQKCTNCNMFGHLEGVCRNRREFSGVMTTRKINRRHDRRQQQNSGALRRRHQKEEEKSEKLTVVKGKINGHVVNIIRDTGCSTVCVNKRLIGPEQLTGQYKMCKLMDGTEKMFETAIVTIDTPYIKQRQMMVMCIDDLEYDIIVGEIEGARCKCNPDPEWTIESTKQE